MKNYLLFFLALTTPLLFAQEQKLGTELVLAFQALKMNF